MFKQQKVHQRISHTNHQPQKKSQFITLEKKTPARHKHSHVEARKNNYHRVQRENERGSRERICVRARASCAKIPLARAWNNDLGPHKRNRWLMPARAIKGLAQYGLACAPPHYFDCWAIFHGGIIKGGMFDGSVACFARLSPCGFIVFSFSGVYGVRKIIVGFCWQGEGIFRFEWKTVWWGGWRGIFEGLTMMILRLERRCVY